MISEQKIKNWWERKIANYLHNYARRNGLTIAQVKQKFFTKTHEKFVESVPQILKKLLDEQAGRNQGPRSARETNSKGNNKPVIVV